MADHPEEHPEGTQGGPPQPPDPNPPAADQDATVQNPAYGGHRDYPAHPPDPDHPYPEQSEEDKAKEEEETEQNLPQGVGPQPEVEHVVIPPEKRDADDGEKPDEEKAPA